MRGWAKTSSGRIMHRTRTSRLREWVARHVFPQVFIWNTSFQDTKRILWADHLRRCECHDSWDQCPCTSSGHRTRQDRLDCPNRCCPWCATELQTEIEWFNHKWTPTDAQGSQ